MVSKLCYVFKENFLLSAVIFLYVLIGFFLQKILGINGMMHVELASNRFIVFAMVVSACFFVINFIRGRVGDYLNVVSISGFIVILFLLGIFKSTFASIKQIIPHIHEFSFDHFLMNLDYYLHFGHHPWLILSFVLRNETLLRVIDLFYMLWFIVLFFFCFWMGWTSNREMRHRFFLTSFFVWAGLGSVLGVIFSSAGPCYYAFIVNEGDSPYQLLMDTLHAIHTIQPLTAIHNQTVLWDAKLANEWLPFGGISAMPSIHVAMSVLYALIAWQRNIILGVIFSLYALLMQVGSVILGWHYAVDGYVAALLTVMLWKYIPRFFLFSHLFATRESGNEYEGNAR